MMLQHFLMIHINVVLNHDVTDIFNIFDPSLNS